MALNELYIVASDLEQLFRNKDTGLPLANGKLKFYRDAARDESKEVFQLSGSPPTYSYTSMGAEINLNAIGVVQNSVGDNEVIYYYPWILDDSNELILDLYYVVCTDENDIEQFTREAWPNITAGNSPIDNNTLKNTNQIANPQFTNIFLNEGYSTTFTISGLNNEFIIAPDWDLVASGTGTVIISRETITGNNNVVTSPPYVLDINVSAGITSCYLRQRMNQNSGLWASTTNFPIYLSGCIVGRNENAGEAGIQIIYQESSGNPPVTILDKKFNNTGYSLQVGSASIPFSTNVNSGVDGYIDILVSILPTTHVRITSIQIAVSQQDIGEDFISYDTNSSNREEALQGDYYLPNLNRRPAKSKLVGWDFPVNPFQFAASGTVTANAYICDQTIACTAGANINWTRNNITDGLVFQSITTNNAFMIMQYLSGDEASKIIGTPLSVNACAWVSGLSSDVTMRVYLVRGSSAASISTLPTIQGSLSTDGTFTLTPANNWTVIPRSGLDTAKAVLPAIPTNPDLNDPIRDTGFTGWEITDDAQITDTDKFAIIVTFAYIDTSTSIYIDSVSLIPSAIPSRPAPQTKAEVLAECQYYYEDSYNNGVYRGTATTDGCVIIEQQAAIAGSPATTYQSFPKFINYAYQTQKRIPVTPAIYSTSGVLGNLSLQFYKSGAVVAGASGDVSLAANFANFALSSKNFSFVPLNQSTSMQDFAPGGVVTATGIESVVMFQYAIDARLGIV